MWMDALRREEIWTGSRSEGMWMKPSRLRRLRRWVGQVEQAGLEAVCVGVDGLEEDCWEERNVVTGCDCACGWDWVCDWDCRFEVVVVMVLLAGAMIESFYCIV